MKQLFSKTALIIVVVLVVVVAGYITYSHLSASPCDTRRVMANGMCAPEGMCVGATDGLTPCTRLYPGEDVK